MKHHIAVGRYSGTSRDKVKAEFTRIFSSLRSPYPCRFEGKPPTRTPLSSFDKKKKRIAQSKLKEPVTRFHSLEKPTERDGTGQDGCELGAAPAVSVYSDISTGIRSASMTADEHEFTRLVASRRRQRRRNFLMSWERATARHFTPGTSRLKLTPRSHFHSLDFGTTTKGRRGRERVSEGASERGRNRRR